MKKSVIVFAALLFLSFISSFCYADSLPSLNEVLHSEQMKNKKIEVQNDFDAYKVFNPEIQDYGEFKILILQRQVPEKEFTEKKYSYSQIEFAKGFDDDFEGVDIGESRVWYRGDLMSQIPSYFRADSLEDADLLFIAENLYVWSGTLTNTTYENNDDVVMPDFDSAEELTQYLSTHQKKISSISYYPVFGVYSLLDMYGVQTKECSFYSSEYKKAKNFARNPEASSQWYNMTQLMDTIELFSKDSVDPDDIDTKLKSFSFVPQQKQELWSTCIVSGEYSTASFSIQEYFWSMAQQLKEMEPSSENRETYDMIIADKNYDALALFVDYCDYSGFDQSMESIKLLKEYMATPDEQVLQNMLNDFIDYLCSLD